MWAAETSPAGPGGRLAPPAAGKAGWTLLVLTAMGKEEMEQAILAGANRAMNKPVLLDALVDDVREMLSEAELGKNK